MYYILTTEFKSTLHMENDDLVKTETHWSTMFVPNDHLLTEFPRPRKRHPAE